MQQTSLAQLTAATPADRDRYVDLLRLASLGVVMLGHAVMAVVVVAPDGTAEVANVLALAPWLQPATWLLQVLPLFFLVGGFAHATALASPRRRGEGYAGFVRSRAVRLLRPTAVFVGVWLAVAVVLGATGRDDGLAAVAAATAAQPLWFLGVYLGVAALAPALHRLHRRLGRRSPAVPAALAATAAVVDALRFGAGLPQAGYLNVALVWLAIHQVGFLWADGSLQRGGRRLAAALALAGLVSLALLTAYGPYPVSMVGLPGDPVSNVAPPTVALLAQATLLTGVVLLLRGPATRLLQRPRLWRAVVRGGTLVMTAYLWHLTALFLAAAAVTWAGVLEPEPGTPEWWLSRPPWLVLVGCVTAALVALFRRFDPPGPSTGPVASGRSVRVSTVVAGSGAALCVVGVLGLSVVGFAGLLTGRTGTLAVVPVTAPGAVLALVAGAALLRVAARPATDRTPVPAGEGPAGTGHLV